MSVEVQVSTPKCEPGLGSVIRNPGDAQLISGVGIFPFQIHPDDRGYFLEVARLGARPVAAFPPASQVSAAVSFPGIIKAFHFHRKQTDFWCPVAGAFQVALVDLRPGSPTFGRKNTLYAGALQPWQILIPPGVGHGYKVTGVEPATLVYITDRHYDPGDEGRIPHNDKDIAYDWELQHK